MQFAQLEDSQLPSERLKLGSDAPHDDKACAKVWIYRCRPVPEESALDCLPEQNPKALSIDLGAQPGASNDGRGDSDPDMVQSTRSAVRSAVASPETAS